VRSATSSVISVCGLPSSSVNTNPVSTHLIPAASRSVFPALQDTFLLPRFRSVSAGPASRTGDEHERDPYLILLDEVAGGC
jgi:hypothetical protein